MAVGGTLLRARYVLPIRPENVLLEQHAVRVLNGRIDAVLPDAEALRLYPDDTQVNLGEKVLMPGLVNSHTHSAMTLLRGYADDLPLDQWLNDHIWPAEARWVSPEFVRDGTELALLEMLRGGTTCFAEMYFFPETIGHTVEQAGMRAVLGTPLIDTPTPWASSMDDGLRKSLEAHETFRENDRLSVFLAPHANYSVDDAGLVKIGALANDSGMRIGMHVLEAPFERAQSIEAHGLAPLQRLHEHELLSRDFMAVHMVQLRDEDIELVAETQAQVVHCPESNLKLGNGACRTQELLDAGANVALGTDGAASNNDLDMISEARTASFLAKGSLGRPDALNAMTTLEMMTINGAKALGLESEVGSLEPGKAADLCAIDLDYPETQPVHNVPSLVVYSAAAHQVSHVWVAGEPLLVDRKATTLDQQAILGRTREWQARMAAA